MQNTPGRGAAVADDEEDDNDEEEEEEDEMELELLDRERLTHFKPLLAGHVDAAMHIDDSEHAHDVLVQYHKHPIEKIPTFESRLLGKPQGRVIFDDGSTGIVYKGDAAYVLFGHGDRADRLLAVCNVLEQVLAALKIVSQHGYAMKPEELMNSIAVNSAQKIRLLGLHALQRKHDNTDEDILGVFRQLAGACLHHSRWEGSVEHEQASKLARELASVTSIAGAEKILAAQHPGHHRL
jgi:hypothetical protein